MYTAEVIKNTISKFRYQIHTEYWYPNLIGIRDLSDVNTFNDTLILLQHRPTDILFLQFPITTDPGKANLINPVNPHGTAILCEGWHKELWKFGKHKGQYDAFVQNKPVMVYRDNDKNGSIDIESEETEFGTFGINLHKAGSNSTYVDKWSAGCQVFKKEENFNKVYNLCKASGVTIFDYYLIRKEDIK